MPNRRLIAFSIAFLLTLLGCSAHEICGNLIDDDSVDGDMPCPEPDKDFDGFESSSGKGDDCDDNDRFLYPGIYRKCGSAGYQLCLSDGAWSDCVESSNKPLCEATKYGRCYYINSSLGDDRNDGSFEKPWATYRRITSYNVDKGPEDRIVLQPGDVVYFFSGVFDDSYLAQTEGATSPHPVGLYLRDINGAAGHRILIKAYPGEQPILRQVLLEGSDYITLEGLRVAENPTSTGIVVKGSSYGGSSDFIEIRNMRIHDNDGIENNNAAGISLGQGASYSRIHHNIVANNYDRQELEQNNTNIVLFGGTANRIDHNLVYNDKIGLGGCIKYKHGTKNGFVEIDHNIVWHCGGIPGNVSAIGGGMPGYFHHNVVANSACPAFRFRDFGGPTYLEKIVVEHNEIINTPGLEVDRSSADSSGKIIYRDNKSKGFLSFP